mgnify:CR=1 FL=1
MGGFFGAASRKSCKYDVFFGTDYHSHLGTKRGGLAFYDPDKGFQRQIHNIENTPFRTKFESDLEKFSGCYGLGCISDTDPQPLLVRSHLGLFAISTVGIITNAEELVEKTFSGPGYQFMAMSSGKVNATELTAALINRCDNLIDGIRYAQAAIEGSCTILILNQDGLIAARDSMGRLPIVIGQGEKGCCAAMESFACQKLGYQPCYNLGPGEIVRVTPDGWQQLSAPGEKMRICAFLWSYYGYPNSNYEGVNVEVMRNRNGEIMARNEQEAGTMPDVDYVAGVPDSGLPHGIGYANFSHKPFARPFVKYTPTWARSFMPSNQEMRNLVAEMKQIPVPELIEGKNRKWSCSPGKPSRIWRATQVSITWTSTPTPPPSGANPCWIPSARKWALIPWATRPWTDCWKPSVWIGARSAPTAGQEKSNRSEGPMWASAPTRNFSISGSHRITLSLRTSAHTGATLSKDSLRSQSPRFFREPSQESMAFARG